MKRICKTLAGILLCLLMLLTMIPTGAFAQMETAQPETVIDVEPAGEITATEQAAVNDKSAPAIPAMNPPVGNALPDEEAADEPAMNASTFRSGVLGEGADTEYPQGAGLAEIQATVPSSYSVRGTWTTPVKNQAENGLCWDFTACAMMETWLMKNGYGVHDLSEMHMAYATSNHSGNTRFGEDRAPYDGGNRDIATAYMMRGVPKDTGGNDVCIGGFVAERDDPYCETLLPDRALDTTWYGKPKYVMPKDVIYLGGTKYNGNGATDAEIKQAVMQYGSVGASLYWDFDEAYNNDSTAAFYLGYNPYDTNHLVQIVGWDDNYSLYNFSASCRPSRDGAWLVKNSWGTNSGDQGYYWVSYYDPVFPTCPWALDGGIGYDSSWMVTHEYDYKAWDNWRWDPYDGNTLYVRSFKTNTVEVISSVQVFLPQIDSTVEVDIIPNLDKANLTTYSFRSLATRKNHYAGWYTIDLDTPVVVAPEQGSDSCFFVVVIRCDKALAYNSSDECINTGFRYDSTGSDWKLGDDSVPWMIKAIGLTGIYSYVEVTSQPQNVTIAEGNDAYFTAGATGGGLSYQWYYRTSSGGTWRKSTFATANEATLVVPATRARNGYQYRCKVTNPVNSEYTRAATLTVRYMPKITKQPSAVTAYVNNTTKFTVEAEGGGLAYQWYYRTSSGDTWKKSSLSTAAKPTLEVKATEARRGYQYRCRIRNLAGTVYSEPATLRVTDVRITTQPHNIGAHIGETALFKVAAKGSVVSYQWQYKKPGGSWTDSGATGARTAALKITVTEARSGYKYRCVITDVYGGKVYSGAATLRAKATITTQPHNIAAPVGETAVFKVVAGGSVASYQWQFKKPGGSWSNSGATGNKTASLKVKTYGSLNGYQYRCVVTDTDGSKVYSKAVKLTVKTAITAQPKSVTATAGTTVKFSVTATGAELTYQWQFKKPDGSWTNSGASGAGTATLSVTAARSMSGYKYRCIITDANGNKTYSSAVTLTVK